MRILGSRILIVLCPWHDADCFLSQHDASDALWDAFTPPDHTSMIGSMKGVVGACADCGRALCEVLY